MIFDFADDNTLSAITETITEIVTVPKSECHVVNDWFKSNHMIMNPKQLYPVING